MNYYENTVIIEPTLSEEDLEAVNQKIKKFITDGGGEILKEDNWGKRNLAYELNKRTQGYYILYTFKAPPSLIQKLEKFYLVYDPVFKFMVIKLEKKQVGALLESLQSSLSEEPSQETVEETQSV
ncbi:MAG: 30S ribosomal protein S6 [Nitrospirae bacterium]|nr:MAG: 30S ribosomal protein S6 [Nitrospirota bacterium]